MVNGETLREKLKKSKLEDKNLSNMNSYRHTEDNSLIGTWSKTKYFGTLEDLEINGTHWHGP